MEPNYGAKPLEGWLIAEQAAQILGLKKQSVFNMMEAGSFSDVRYVGDRPTYLILESEVWAIKEAREEAAYARFQAALAKFDRA